MIEIVGLEKGLQKDELSRYLASARSPGRIGLVGPNGSGKTTLFRMRPEEHPDRGEIRIRKGVHIGYLSPGTRPLKVNPCWRRCRAASRTCPSWNEKCSSPGGILRRKKPGNAGGSRQGSRASRRTVRETGRIRPGVAGQGDSPRPGFSGRRLFALFRGAQRRLAHAAGSGQDPFGESRSAPPG